MSKLLKLILALYLEFTFQL